MIATMFQIAQSIQILISSISKSQAKLRMMTLNIALCFFSAIFICGVFLSYSALNFDTISIFWMYTLFYLSMSIVFLCTMIFIHKMIEKLNKGPSLVDFTKEKKSVKRQFLIFLISFVTRVLYFTVKITHYYIYGYEEEGDRFTSTFIVLLLYIPWNAVPILVILWEHNRTFKTLSINRSAVSSSPTSAIDSSELRSSIFNKKDMSQPKRSINLT